MKVWINTDEDGRIVCSTPYKKFTDDNFIEVEFDDDFDFGKQSDYLYKDGELVYDGAMTAEIEEMNKKLAEEEARKEQLNVAARMFVQTTAKTMTDSQAMQVNMLFKDWCVGMSCEHGDIIRYDGNIYRIGIDHVASDVYHPGDDGTTNMYSLIKIDEEGYEYWKAWDGVTGLYDVDDIVRDPEDEQLYICIQGNCTYGPPHSTPSFWKIYKE